MKAHGMMNDNNNYDCYKMTFEKGVSLAIIGLIILMSIAVVIYSIFDATDTSPRWWVELYHDPMVFLALAYLLVNCLLFFWIFINKIQGRALIIAIVPKIEERRALGLKGYYCFEPEMMDEKEYYGDVELPFKTEKCLKDNKVLAKLTISEHCGQSSITLEWYSSTKELAEKPLTEIVQEHVGRLTYKGNISLYCKFNDWDDLA